MPHRREHLALTHVGRVEERGLLLPRVADLGLGGKAAIVLSWEVPAGRPMRVALGLGALVTDLSRCCR